MADDDVKDNRPQASTVLQRHLLADFAEGRIAWGDFFYRLLDLSKVENTEAFFQACPDEVMSGLRQTLEAMPRDNDDKGWGSFQTGETACFLHGCQPTSEELQHIEDARRQHVRRAVRALRSHVYRAT